jgi:hypothetical protein
MTTTRPGIGRKPAAAVDPVRRKGRGDQIMETIASGLGNIVAWMAENGILFAIFAVIWIVVAAGLIFSQGSVDQAWQTIAGLPLVAKLAVWVLFLPVMMGLWVWETTWPLIIRLVLVVGVAGWNLLIFLPKALQAKP